MKKLKPYIYTSLLVLGIFLILFLIKGIYPFGNNSLIWGDMHDQITAFYYHFYDSVYGTKSLFVDFTTSGGVNFFGIFAYYLISPFTLLVLLFPRTDIYLAISLIIVLKFVVASITCLYFLRTYYKNMPSILSTLLAIIYTFSGYSLMMYQITPWMDIVYMFPLLMIGLKKLLDLEKPIYYIITLTLCLIFSFYLTGMVLIFIFLVSLIYILVYKDSKEDRKKIITSLGLSTLLSGLMSSFVVIPSYLQISVSYRMGFKMNELLNSRFGPITDKLCMMMFGAIVYVGLVLLFKEYKNNKKFLKFYIPTLLILLVPFIVEPVNKVWHFGSYASFPYRFGFITVFLLIVGAAQYFNTIKLDEIKEKFDIKKIITIAITGISCLCMIFLAYRYHNQFQTAIYKLSLSFNHRLIIISGIFFLIAFISTFVVYKLNKKVNKFSLILIFIISLGYIITNSYIYIGMDRYQKPLMSQYEILNKISKDYKKDDYFRIKSDVLNLVMNNGMVTKYHNLDHFTSLTDKNNLESLRKLGFSSMWVKTYSRGSNIFIDTLLGNKYLITEKETNNPYYKLVKKYDTVYFYELDYDISYGFLIDENDTIFDKNNSFEVSNSLYKNILDVEDNLFEIEKGFSLANIKITGENDNIKTYEVIDENYPAYFEKELVVTGKKEVYFEITSDLDNTKNRILNDAFNLYINDKLFLKDAFMEPYNGVIYLGTYEDETINIRLDAVKNVKFDDLVIGMMDSNKYEEFLNTYKIDTDVKFRENTVSIKVDSNEEKILFLPIGYSDSYKATNNGKKIDIIKLYDNYMGIKLNKGSNDIKLTYIPAGFKLFRIVSIISLIITLVILKTKFYQTIINNKVINTMGYYVYLLLYIAAIFLIYVLLTLCFFISFIKYIRI